MTIVSISSQKGGVGKTTLALNLAYSLARRSWKVLLLDADPQGAIGLSLSKRAKKTRGTSNVLAGEAKLEDCVLSTKEPNLCVVTSGTVKPYDVLSREGEFYTREKIRGVIDGARTVAADILLIDTPAGFFGPTLEFLNLSDYVLAPEQAEPLSVRSTPQALEILSRIRKDGVRARLAGIIMTMVQPDSPESQALIRELRGMLPKNTVLDHVVPRDKCFLEASAKGIPVSLLYKNPPAAALVFDQIAAEFETRARLGQKTYEHGQPILLD